MHYIKTFFQYFYAFFRDINFAAKIYDHDCVWNRSMVTVNVCVCHYIKYLKAI